MDLIDPTTVVDEKEDDNLELEEDTVEIVENDGQSNGVGGDIPQSPQPTSSVAAVPVEITVENAHYHLPAS